MSGINQKLEHKLIQKLSPQQIQLIKLLEVPIIELEQRIKKEIEENPAIEEGKELDDEENDVRDEDDDISSANEEDDEINEPEEVNTEDEFSVDDYLEDDEIPNYKLNDNNYAEETERPQNYYSEGFSFHEFMFSQLSTLELDDKNKEIVKYFIGSIDDAGYLRRDISSITNDLLLFYNLSVSEDEVEGVLKNVQEQLDPPGVLARNLQESLVLQVKRKLLDKHNDRILLLSFRVLQDFFDEFSKKHYEKIINKLSINNGDMRSIIKEIVRLNPKPGNSFSIQNKKNIFQVVPDFVLSMQDNELVVDLNSANVPSLRVSKTYEGMLRNLQDNAKSKKRSDKNTIVFVKNKLDSAKWFIEAIKQRQNTLINTMEAILKYQIDFFKSGDESKLKPMILKDIAEITNLDISTISRVANSKYIQTPFGIFSLKFFFSEGMEDEDGKEVSTRKIKKILKEAIQNENKSKPLTDERLAKLLQEKGFKIARRTVAKYREQMDILVARLRKKI